MTVKTRIQKFCFWCLFLGRVDLGQYKTALKSVEPYRIMSPAVETLKSKTVLYAKKADNTENEISDKINLNTFLISRFLL